MYANRLKSAEKLQIPPCYHGYTQYIRVLAAVRENGISKTDVKSYGKDKNRATGR